MNLRSTQARDLDACLAIDESFETDHVWQMETGRIHGGHEYRFRTTRLPRPMRVIVHSARDTLAEHFELGEGFFVVEEYPRILGYVDATMDASQHSAWIQSLVVASDWRRKGIGTQLVRQILAWAQEKKARAVMANISTKNFPASLLLQKQGFMFCGFNEQYYHNRDIALFFACTLR